MTVGGAPKYKQIFRSLSIHLRKKHVLNKTVWQQICREPTNFMINHWLPFFFMPGTNIQTKRCYVRKARESNARESVLYRKEIKISELIVVSCKRTCFFLTESVFYGFLGSHVSFILGLAYFSLAKSHPGLSGPPANSKDHTPGFWHVASSLVGDLCENILNLDVDVETGTLPETNIAPTPAWWENENGFGQF